MKAPFYIVTAFCSNPNCDGEVFRRERKKTSYVSSCGVEQRIATLVCPGCRMHAEIIKFELVSA